MKINLTHIYYYSKSSTCMNKDGNPLSVYSTFEEAQNSAYYIEKSMIPYLCKKCGKYHLKPQEFYCEKVNRSCACVDHNGKPKDTYKTKEDALKMTDIRSRDGVMLYVYECPQGCGYHLTSRNMIY